jgi:SAM-dependent methyltransferase
MSDDSAGPPPTVRWEDRRLAFGGWAGAYDRWRPGYPVEAVRWLLDHGAPGGGALDVVDLASGTGRLGAVVAGLGHRVVAVEPDEAMRAVAEQVLPGLTRLGTAEGTGLPAGCADAVVVGQAFHWFDVDRALPEIARVLRPGGVLGVVWNIRDERVDWVRRFVEAVGGEDRMASMRSALRLSGAYGPVDRATFPHSQELDPDGLVALAESYSYVALRPDRSAVVEAIRALTATHPDLAGRDRFALPYLSNCFRAVRLPATG